MKTEKQLIAHIKRCPADIAEIDNPSERVQLACVQSNPWQLGMIKNPLPSVKLTVFRKEYSLIRYELNPTVEEQLAAVSNSFFAHRHIKNPCREAVLAILEEYGRYFTKLAKLQKELGSDLAATKVPLVEDIEIQAAALSNITGLDAYKQMPELFNIDGLNKCYPGLVALVDTYVALDVDFHYAADIVTRLKAIKESSKPTLTQVDLPSDIAL